MSHPNEQWFTDVVQLYGLRDLCKNGYVMVNHDMLSMFVGKWKSDTSSFHLSHGEMFITLDDVSCLMLLPIRGRMLDHDRINKDHIVEMMVGHLRADLGDSLQELEATRGAHARFLISERMYA